jgi:D-aminopeptidase
MYTAPITTGSLAFVAATLLCGSGDYVVAFSTAPQMRIRTEDKASPRQAVIEATEEAVYNSLLRAKTITGRGACDSRY